jgi:signal transduction histidine kinase
MKRVEIIGYLSLKQGVLLFVISGMAISCLSLFFETHQPWIGIDVDAVAGQRGLVVSKVDPDGPAANILNAGDVIRSVSSIAGSPGVQLKATDAIRDPDTFRTFTGLNAFLARQNMLASFLRRPVLHLFLDGGRTVSIQPDKSRPLAAVPVSYWLLLFYGAVAWIICAAVFFSQQSSLSGTLFVIAGLGFLVLTNSAALIVTRDFALSAAFLHKLTAIYHFGNDLFTVGLIGLVWNYPRRLVRGYMLYVAAFIATLFWFNERLQLTELPVHTILFQVPIYFFIIVTGLIWQWRASKSDPVSRAVIKWLILSMIGGTGTGIIIYYVPVLLESRPSVSIVAGLGMALVMFIGFALGITRSRLFDVERWWAVVWAWLFVGTLVIVVDLLLVELLGARHDLSLFVSIALIAWIYFPLRQYLVSHFLGDSAFYIEKILPVALKKLLAKRIGDQTGSWQDVLQEVFQPLQIYRQNKTISAPVIERNGELLLVPSLTQPDMTLVLQHAHKGERLFHQNDVDVSDTLFRILNLMENEIKAYRNGQREEQRRILRDLHDEVGGRILTLVHEVGLPQERQLARDALGSLREVIYHLDDHEPMDIEMAATNWRDTTRNRCDAAKSQLQWHNRNFSKAVYLSGRQYFNLGRVIGEAVSNSLRHAPGETIEVDLQLAGGLFAGEIRNHTDIALSQAIRYGKGLNNMKTRIEEIGGAFSVEYGAGTFAVTFDVPIGERERK